MNCCDVPEGMLAVAGVTAIETSVAAVTFRLAVPDIPLAVAVTVEGAIGSAVTPVANPAESIVATAMSLVDQAAVADKSCVVASL